MPEVVKEGEGQGEATKVAPPAPEVPEKVVVADVPYGVFRAVNERLRGIEGERDILQAKLTEREGWKPPKAVEDLLALERTRGERLLLLADSGVDPRYRDFMLGRLDAEKPKDAGAYLEQLRATEAAFFLHPSTAGEPQRPPPRSSPDRGAGSAAPGDGRAVTADDISSMTVPEYLAWKQAGGLDRIKSGPPAR